MRTTPDSPAFRSLLSASLTAAQAPRTFRCVPLTETVETGRTARACQRKDSRERDAPHDEHAQCGIRWYYRSPRDRDRGSYWTHCHACGQALIYTSDPNARPQVCAGHKL